jgi:16S rRNA (guanine(527)-N(7))-methyltransferase RsmG
MRYVFKGLLPYSGCMFGDLPSGVLNLAHGWSFSLTTDIAERVCLYFRRLLEWNVRVNLTGACSMADLIGNHLPDSFAVSRFVPPDSDVVDVGSGGGLPAIPFSIIRPDCRVTLLEPRAKRIAFLNTAVRECGCGNANVVRGRVEDCDASGFTVAMSRATFPPEVWFAKAPLILGPDGRIVVLSSDDASPSIRDARLLDSVEYQTAVGVKRWAGYFCSTWNTSKAD